MKTYEIISTEKRKDYYLSKLYLLDKDNDWIDQGAGNPFIEKIDV